MEKETAWIDAWIRWDRNSKDIVDEEQIDEVGKEERVPPTTSFSFHYTLPARHCDSCTCEPLNLTLSLGGFPSESEQVWNSTGLTLWPSSHFLCEYLLHHYHKLLKLDLETSDIVHNTKTTTGNKRLRKIRAIELGSGLGRCGLLLHHLLATLHIVGSHIYLTDGDTDTLAQLRDNVIDNTKRDGGTESTASVVNDQRHEQHNDQHNQLHHISCHQLLWGRNSAETFCQRHFSNILSDKSPDTRISQESSNSGCPVSLSCVDLVFGSDLIYTPRVIVPLFETVTTLLENRDGAEFRQRSHLDGTATKTKPIFLMSHSDRREGSSVTLKMVLEGAEIAGLKSEILQEIVTEEIYIIAFRI